MSSFNLESDNENRLCEPNIPSFSSPKRSEKDFSVILPSNGDRSFKLSSPIGTLGSDYKLNFVDSSSSLNDSTILLDAENSVVQEDTANDAVPEETSEQRMQREERESQELAWQLMQEDNMEMYNMQLQFMQENADQMSEEDLQLIQALVNESGHPQIAVAGLEGGNEEEDAEDEEEGDELNESDAENWDYERLLQLGQQIGDVKTERWRLRAKSVISSLPRQLYSELMPQPAVKFALPTTVFTSVCQSPTDAQPVERDEQSSSNKKQCIRAADCGCDVTATATHTTEEVQTERCVVCMDDFEAQEELVVFPCKHYFHIPCTEGWLADHNFCPSCKTKVSATPEK